MSLPHTFFAGRAGGGAVQLTPFTVSSVTASGSSYSFGFASENLIGHDVSPDGTQLTLADYDISGTQQRLFYVKTSVPWDFSSGNLTVSTEVAIFSGISGRAVGVAFNPTGNYMLITQRETNGFTMHSLSTPFDPRTATLQDSFDTSSVVANAAANGASISPDGTKISQTEQNDKRNYVWNLSIPFDLGSASLFYSGRADDDSAVDILGGDWDWSGNVYAYMHFGDLSTLYVKEVSSPWNANALVNTTRDTYAVNINAGSNMTEPKFHYDAQKLTVSDYGDQDIYVFDCVLNPL